MWAAMSAGHFRNVQNLLRYSESNQYFFGGPAHKADRINRHIYMFFFISRSAMDSNDKAHIFKVAFAERTSGFGLLQTLHNIWTARGEQDVKFFIYISIFCSMPNLKAASSLVDVINCVCDGGDEKCSNVSSRNS